ncbi:hypothetical protein TRICI_004749 [Trichomonascus ciferrii]|uniref:Exonuclease V, mitochondrial n=1 Tax=Trichomonascus ciferrii TaxID=44093 RepID=A0A642V4I0_9ASCO|nr:hypothetical protein TRICI_004749 [Trichomonascus ciferrii]
MMMRRVYSSAAAVREIPASRYISPLATPWVRIADEDFFPTKLTNASMRDLFRRTSYSVSDLKTQYCELRSFYELILSEPSVQTPAMVAGSDIHKTLELATNVEWTTVPESAIQSVSDQWAVKFLQARDALNQLRQMGVVREGYVFGLLRGRLVTGYIDLLQVNDGEIQITDTKTRLSNSLPPDSQQTSAYHQLLLYYQLLNYMRRPEGLRSILRYLKLNTSKQLSLQLTQLTGFGTLEEVVESCEETFTNTLPVSLTLNVEYVGRANRPVATVTYTYDDTIYQQLLNYSLALWEGQRDPVGVSQEEVSKCKHCRMAPKCSWYNQLS